MPPTPNRHLVVGGSQGIGLAYAAFHAQRGDEVYLVARSAPLLERAKEALVRAGAASVEVLAGDVLQCSFRQHLLAEVSNHTFDTALLGGPSPPAGRREEVTADQVALACETCLAYPLQMLHGLCSRARHPLLVNVIGSSASGETLDGHRFFLSATFRRLLDAAVAAMGYNTDPLIALDVWRPHVVLTRLSARFALRRPIDSLADLSADERDEAIGRLKLSLGVAAIPTADDYVRDMLGARST